MIALKELKAFWTGLNNTSHEWRKLFIRTRIIVSLIVVAAFMFFSQPSIADDLADLKATHQRYDKAWNTGDVAGVFEIWQDGGIRLPTSQGFPIVTNSAMGIQMFTNG